MQTGCFQKIGVPQNGWFISWKTLLKWMIWGFSHIFGNTQLLVSGRVDPMCYHHLMPFQSRLASPHFRWWWWPHSLSGVEVELFFFVSCHRVTKKTWGWSPKSSGQNGSPPKTNMLPEKLEVGRLFFFWNGPFSGDMFIFGGVNRYWLIYVHEYIWGGDIPSWGNDPWLWWSCWTSRMSCWKVWSAQDHP